ncbi:hypothetical protein NS303_04580 [Pantoea ananatis]|uniref:hypothetical protein n=1 Tax=Pantoea ananas TaxID=553 RepID=UPI0007373769|nr:hypothetical protein [Pantoea ananatis]KTR49353.1 hypothetical protein NS303_04580 [Pantoea ananatis]KTR50872.1 hypothetical protein NS311_21705 [Pantoea ananatis]KTR65496.1 hypothetical protein RSA47_05490 [Pantoea ananatis]KTR69727.1 hypothetical protein NS296_14025 [Pantoea ananatis]
MPPDLIGSYTKDLTIELEGNRGHLDTCYFFTVDGGLFRVDEYVLSGGAYHYYLDIYLVGCSTADFYIEHGCELHDQGMPHDDIVESLLVLDMEDKAHTKKIGRVAYKDFRLQDSGFVTIAKQIKSVVIDKDYRDAGLARNVYKLLTLKHNYIVCDNTQSISGGSLWASSILILGEVRIYDTRINKFLDVLAKEGKGRSGLIPWSCQTLTIAQIEEWGRSFNPNSCHHIVNVLSKDSLY